MEKKLKALLALKLLVDSLEMLQEFSDLEEKRERSRSVRTMNRDRKRMGFFEQTFVRIRDVDHEQFFIYTRMSPQIYKHLLKLVTPFLQKNSLRVPVKPECRLAVTLLYLTQGNSLQSLAWSFKLGKETVRNIVLETTEMICSKLGSIYVSEPNADDYERIAQDFWSIWDMPNCIGAIDGKHIAIQFPSNSGRKKCSSIVLLAACDARYRFTQIDIGAYGSRCEGSIFQLSQLGKKLLSNQLPIPQPKNLPNSEVKVPYYFVGDVAFPLGTNLMGPFPGELLPNEKDIFNKRLSRARRTIENAFGVLMSRWRILLTTLHLLPENAEKIVLACVVLHNFIMQKDMNAYIPRNYVDGEDENGENQAGSWRTNGGSNIPSISPSKNAHHYGGKNSIEIRNSLCSFFNRP